MSNSINMNMVILAEKQVHNIHKDHKDPFHLPMASVWVLTKNGEMACRQVGPDVYDLLDSPDTINAIKDSNFFGILTCGWAAQIEDGAISVLRFKDNADEIVTDDNKAKGSLADAVMDLYHKKKTLEMIEETINEN